MAKIIRFDEVINGEHFESLKAICKAYDIAHKHLYSRWVRGVRGTSLVAGVSKRKTAPEEGPITKPFERYVKDYISQGYSIELAKQLALEDKYNNER